MKTKLILFFIVSFSLIFGSIFQEATYIANQEELVETLHSFSDQKYLCLVLPTKESFEYKVLQKMALEEHWTILRQWAPLSAKEYLPVIRQENLHIIFQEPHRTFLKGPILQEWLEMVLAPRLGVEDKARFVEEFLLLYGKESALCKELVIGLEIDDSSFTFESHL